MKAALHPFARYAKPAAFLVYGVSFLPRLAERLAGVEGAGAQAAYLGLFAVGAVGIYGAATIHQAALRWTVAAIIFAGAYLVEVYARSTRDFLTYGAFIELLHATGFAGDAMNQNRAALLGGLWRSLALLLAVGLAPRPRAWPCWRFAPLALPLVLGALTLLAYFRGGDGLRGLPGGYAAMSYSLLAGYERATNVTGPREPVRITLARPPLYSDIVLIVDESIAGQYLDLNGPGGVVSGLAAPRQGLSIVNFGIAASATNCSAGSNLVLRFAAARDSYRRDVAVGPSLWDYARKAGMETVYIDAQRTGGALQNLMNEEERARIDRFIQFDRIPVVERDMAAADALARVMGDARPSFVIVNKVGAHFPIADKYPEARTIYRPTLPRGAMVGITDTGSRAGFSGSAKAWRRYRNSYRNTLAWNVGGFFDRLLAQVDLAGDLIIYTSDHGQNLHEDGRPGTTTHCSVDPRPEEGAVPLVALQGERGALSFAPTGPTSHYMIAPTLLAAMGYDRGRVRARHGAALDEPSHDPATFNYLFNARLNRQPQWRKVDPVRFRPIPRDGS